MFFFATATTREVQLTRLVPELNIPADPIILLNGGTFLRKSSYMSNPNMTAYVPISDFISDHVGSRHIDVTLRSTPARRKCARMRSSLTS